MPIEMIKKSMRDFLAIENKRVFWIKTTIALTLLLLALGLNIYMGRYVDSTTGPQVPDLLIEHLPVWNSGYLLGPVAVLFTFFIFFAAVFSAPSELPFILSTIALFIFVRSLFIGLTHLGPINGAVNLDYRFSVWLNYVTFRNDFFFSGHVGYPFLMFFVARHKWLKCFCFSYSILMAIVVLLNRNHYSIDVFAAFFIAYGIYGLSKFLFSWLKNKNFYSTQNI
jgi:hypothetical protein